MQQNLFNFASFTTYGDLYIVTFQNATGDLVFIHDHDIDGTDAGLYYTFDTPVTSDSDGSVGAWRSTRDGARKKLID